MSGGGERRRQTMVSRRESAFEVAAARPEIGMAAAAGDAIIIIQVTM